MSDAKSRLLRDIDRLLGYIMIDMGHPAKHLAKISGKSPATVYHWSLLEFRPDANFTPKFIEKVGESAVRIRRGEVDYQSVRKMLFDYARKNEPVGREMYVDPARIQLQQRLMYAVGIANLWAGCQNGGADIYTYAESFRGRYPDFEDHFFILPEKVLPRRIRESPNAKRPFYAIAYMNEKKMMVFLDEDGNETKPVKMTLQDDNAKPVLCISGKAVSDICLDFFKRHNYDTSKNLKAQIIEDATRYKRELTGYSSASLTGIEHRVSDSNGRQAGAY